MAVAGAKAQGGEIPTDSLIWHYAFDNNGNDSSGNSNTLSSDGGITYGTNRHNVSNKCAYFDGDARFYRVDGINGTFTKKATFAFWVKSTQYDIRITQEYNSTNCVRIGIVGGKVSVNDYYEVRGNSASVNIPTITVNDGEWHFIQIYIDREADSVYDAFEIKVDGVIQQLTYYTYIKTNANFGSFIYIIGAILNYGYFTGYLDDFRYYTRKLTSGEDTALLNE